MFFPPPPDRDERPTTASPTVGPTADPSIPAHERDLRTFVGANADYYLWAWTPAMSGEGGVRGFNLAAAFFGPNWLVYRRMHGSALLVYAILAVALVIDAISPPDHNGQRPPLVSGLTAVGVAFALGFLGNYWYLTVARRAVARWSRSSTAEPDGLAALQRAGGVNLAGAIICALGVGTAFRFFAAIL